MSNFKVGDLVQYTDRYGTYPMVYEVHSINQQGLLTVSKPKEEHWISSLCYDPSNFVHVGHTEEPFYR